jgi:hypothetical protein
MKRILLGCAFAVALTFTLGTTATEAGDLRFSFGSGRYGHGHGGQGYYSRGYGGLYGNNYGYRGNYGYRRGHSHWHDTSHYDYHPGSFQRHYNHYHYVPGHYDRHYSGHWDHH